MSSFFLCLYSCSEINSTKNIKINDITVEYLTNPLGIDDPHPSINWTMTSEGKSKKQSAYRIIVAASQNHLNKEANLLWDSGKIVSDQNSQIRYSGKPLESGQNCYFKIQVWDENDNMFDWSDTAYWTMGLLKEEDWKANWIGFKTNDYNSKDSLHLPAASYLRKTFSVEGKVKRATLYVTSLGVFEMSLNGERIGNDLLAPGWSDYNQRIYYKTYDLTDHVDGGMNALGSILGDGWYAGYVGPKELSNPKNRELYGTNPALLCQLEIEYENGHKEIIASDESWKGSEGPWVYADLLMGTEYNANLELKGWHTPDYNDQNWQNVYLHEGTQGVLQAYPGNSIQVYDKLEPIEITEPKENVYIFNLGQNFAGHARLKVSGSKNDTIIMRFGEMLHSDGSLMTENLRFARATDTYILKGEGTEVWEPKFTYHGFQYVEVTGLKEKPDKTLITGIAFGSSIPMGSSFTSSDDTLNRMFENVLWTQRSNFMEVPTDSPQRDERLGWLGDVQIFSKSALYNANLGAFNAKWFADVRDAQYDFGPYSTFAPRPYPKLIWYSPGWMEAGVMVPYNTFKFYNDTKIVEDHYESMTRFMNYHIEKSGAQKFYQENSWTEIGPKGGFGDWLSMTEKNLAHDIMASMYYQYALKIMAEMSEAIGKTEKSTYYKRIYEASVKAFIQHYLNEDGKFIIDETAYGDGAGYFEGEKGFTGHTQSAYATAIYFDILPQDLRDKAAYHLVQLIEDNENLPTSGILGIRQLLPALSLIGRSDLAYKILLKKDYPSWGFQVKNGATTIWERWNSYTPEKGFNGAMNAKMNSFNHYAFGAFSQFLFSDLAGISTEDSGFKRIVFKPVLGDYSLSNVRGEYQSINGRIVSSWTIDASKFILKVEIPVNTTAKVYVPSLDAKKVMANGKEVNTAHVKFLKQEKGYKIFEVGSGSYEFESEIQKL
ncbi:alpha-L-rhamnosidase [Cellulophaga sp. Hel_I_12]|uniref:alpha-L-rhamnosidase n=1 Tax=Cellulophaga sp. Hel_I_12 TaxID=1249972 RepID=UPI0018CECE79|nr:alpha-L-rhamnosidase [Cellulophaga sp. Hel_I_12]